VVQGELLQQVKQLAQFKKPMARFHRELNRMKGAFSDFLYLFFL
jgi:hypothetical protein